jgi:hypothetical protein
LIRNFVQARTSEHLYAENDDRFFEALEMLDPERHVRGMLATFELATDQDLVRILAERLLRSVFEDQRSGWGQIAMSRVNEDGSRPPGPDLTRLALRSIGMLILWKLFPIMLRWKLRKKRHAEPKGIRKIDYWGLEGSAPELPAKLTETQQNVLAVFVAKAELWKFRTNLWELYGLPASADALRQFLANRTV